MKVKARAMREKKGEMEQEGRVRLLAELDSTGFFHLERKDTYIDSEIAKKTKRYLTGASKTFIPYTAVTSIVIIIKRILLTRVLFTESLTSVRIRRLL